MKIGILTFHWAQNYGAVLQCYALKCKLEEMGHDVYIIDRIPKYRGFLRKLYHRFSYKYWGAWIPFSRFNRYVLIPKTRTEELDAVVVGSDQVWRWNLMGYTYFLDFVDGSKTRKYAYAASFGLSHWTDNGLDTERVRALLNEFRAISVRERTGVKICREQFGVEAQLVMDPTLLFDAAFYERNLLGNFPPVCRHRIVSYILGEENVEQCLAISHWADEKSLEYVDLFWTRTGFPALKQQGKKFFHFTVSEWLDEIRGAEVVITNSFHCTVFAILFRKPFVVLNNQSGGSDRLKTLLDALGLGDRFFSSVSDYPRLWKRLYQPIDYEAVASRIRACRQESLSFLQHIK